MNINPADDRPSRIEQSESSSEVTLERSPLSSQSPTRRTSNPAARFCAILIGLPAIFLLLGFRVIPSDWFLHHSKNTYLVNMGFGAKLRDANCQIVIYGDSSALVAVDPDILTQETGLSACNIAEFAGMTMVNDMLVLNTYLQHNRPPKYLIFQFAPENLAPYRKWQTVSLFEAILFRLRQEPGLQSYWLLAQHPAETFSFLETGWRLALGGSLGEGLPPDAFHVRESHHGYLPVPGDPLTSCSSEKREHQPDYAWMQNLRSRYAVRGTTVLFDVTPEPSCDPTFNYYAYQFPTHTDNPLEAFPVNLYNGSGRLHMTRAGTERFSHELASQIRLNIESAVDSEYRAPKLRN